MSITGMRKVFSSAKWKQKEDERQSRNDLTVKKENEVVPRQEEAHTPNENSKKKKQEESAKTAQKPKWERRMPNIKAPVPKQRATPAVYSSGIELPSTAAAKQELAFVAPMNK